MRIILEGNDFRIEPDLPELRDALNAINSMRNPDELVTYALRRHGYVNDGWSVTYPEDQDELEKEENYIPDGYVEICCIGCGDEKGPQIKEESYVKILLQVCEIHGLTNRAQLLLDFLKTPELTNNLIEASAERCNERWRQFVPFLVKHGWKNNNNKIEFANGEALYNIEFCTSDLNVMYRDAIRSLEKNNNARKEWVDYQTSIKIALEEFFAFENEQII